MYHPLKQFAQREAAFLVLLDAVGAIASFWLALAFRFDGRIPLADMRLFLWALPFVVVLFIGVNTVFGLYRYVWRYTSASEVVVIQAAVAASTACLMTVSLLSAGTRLIPISVVVLGGVLSGCMFVVARYRQRLLTGLMGYLQRIVGSPDRRRVLIVGAGQAGYLLARQFKGAKAKHRYELVGFVDNDPKQQGLWIGGARVLGDCRSIPAVVAQCNVSLIVIAVHPVGGAELREILSICLTTETQVKILPDFFDGIEQTSGVLPLRHIAAEDLLGRELCKVDEVACQHIIAGKVVMVTGAAGSIGSELCRQILALRPRRLLMVDNNETGLHDLTAELNCPDADLVCPIVADVTNQAKIESIFATRRPQVVFHVAAYKHVPMMEHHPEEAVRVNVLGTAVMADLARHYSVERFVFISTDKAVNPSSIMGATKRVGELLILSNGAPAGDRPQSPVFTAVRFGNVLGSRGSVVPTFVRQIECGGPITITHPEMTRYFISISEAVSLVIQAASLTEGGDIFMLDMGQPIRIEDLARKMIRLRGLRPGQDIPIVYSSMRPGEKLHEELISSDEERLSTPHPRIFRIRTGHAWNPSKLLASVSRLIELGAGQHISDMVDYLWALVRAGQPPVSLEPIDAQAGRPAPSEWAEESREVGTTLLAQ